MAPTCFGLRPSSGSLQLSLAKVISILKHSVMLHHNLLCGGVMVCVLCAVQSRALHSTQHTHHNTTLLTYLLTYSMVQSPS